MVIVSGFLPVPLPMMIPFMGAQSLVIGKMFGEGFQYGKRKISAMPNEEFNALTFQGMMQNARDEMKASIPTMIAALQDMQPMVQAVIHEFFDYLAIIADKSKEELRRITGGGEFDLTPEAKRAGTSAGFQLSAEDIAKLVEIGQQKAPGIQMEDIMNQLRSLFPSLPEAGGHTATIPLVTDTSRPSTVPGKTIAQARAEAARKQALHEEQLREKQKFALQLAKTTQPTPQIAVTNLVGKKAAGQSQKMERLRLIEELRIAQFNLKWRGQGRQPNPGRLKEIMAQKALEFRRVQQQLINLLARYKF